MPRRQVKSDQIKFEAFGDSLTAKYITENAVMVKGSEGVEYVLERADGSGVTLLGTTILNRLMPAVQVGDLVYIEYVADTRTPGGTMKEFEVYILDSWEDGDIETSQ